MLDRATLEQRLRALTPPTEATTVSLLVQRSHDERRVRPDAVVFDKERGVLGDRWYDSPRRKEDAQISLMRYDVASTLHDDPAELGDNLFATIDTSAANLPPGTVLTVGAATCIVTAKAHTGCYKFEARAGGDALALTRDPDWKASQLRGVFLRVLEGGTVRVGDPIEVISRP